MMKHEMMNQCCGPDGKPDFAKMCRFMERHDRASKLDTLGWGLFFVWVGIAWLADVGLGIGLLGVAAITLGMQLVRKSKKLRVEGFWVVVGLLFALGGIWQLLAIETPLVPILLIVAGLALLVWMLRSKPA